MVIGVRDIQVLTAVHYEVPLHLLVDSSERMYAHPRQVAMYLARKLTKKSYPQIGRAFQRTHGAVQRGCDKVRTRMSECGETRRAVACIRALAEAVPTMRGSRLDLQIEACNAIARALQFLNKPLRQAPLPQVLASKRRHPDGGCAPPQPAAVGGLIPQVSA